MKKIVVGNAGLKLTAAQGPIIPLARVTGRLFGVAGLKSFLIRSLTLDSCYTISLLLTHVYEGDCCRGIAGLNSLDFI